MKVRHPALTVLFLVLLCASASRAQQQGGADEAGFVTAVPAGDLLVVSLPSGPLEVRLRGASSPQLGESPGQREYFAENARDFTRRLALRKRVTLRGDQALKTATGESLMQVLLPGGRLLAMELVRSGHGFATEDSQVERRDELMRAEVEARTAGRGLWQGEGIDEAEWYLREARATFHLHRMTDASWGVQVGRQLRSHVSDETLPQLLAQLRDWTESLDEQALEGRLKDAGFVRVDPGKEPWRRLIADAPKD